MKITKPTILIIIGIFGDLSVRKLLPALGQMIGAGALPDDFSILGVTRRSNEQIDKLLIRAKKADYLKEKIELFSMNLTEINDYKKLSEKINEIERKLGVEAQHIFYLAVPPQVSQPIIELLGESGLAREGETKLLLEKPFGVDLDSASELVKYIDKYFDPEQVYRIDHYLAKEMAQNIIVFRENNFLFCETWNNKFITAIEIIATESIGVEGRAIFYEQTGALRDLIQSHLLQLASLVLMDISSNEKIDLIPSLRLQALKQLNLASRDSGKLIRGQYEGYQNEVSNIGSSVETFVSLRLESSDSKWLGVPITLTTGKSLDKKFTGIRIFYKNNNGKETNQLIFSLQPDEGVELQLFAKRPGYDNTVSQHSLKFAFQEYYANLPEAYEQVLFNALNSDHALFASSAEVLETWRIINDIQNDWKMSSDDLIIYKPGSKIKDILN